MPDSGNKERLGTALIGVLIVTAAILSGLFGNLAASLIGAGWQGSHRWQIWSLFLVGSIATGLGFVVEQRWVRSGSSLAAEKPVTSTADHAGQQRTVRLSAWNIKNRSMLFFSRDEIMEEITRISVDTPVVLSGIPGVGKTQLALACAQAWRDRLSIGWWIDAEREELIGGQFQEFARALGIDAADWSTPSRARAAVHALLSDTRDWLLIFDNVSGPLDVEPWIPPSRGHVLITTRSTASWMEISTVIRVGVLDEESAVGFLRSQRSELSVGSAALIAQALGRLPLALSQAIGLLGQGIYTPEGFLAALAAHPAMVLREHGPLTYRGTSIELVVRSTWAAAGARDPLAGALIDVLAHLAPEPVPLGWLAAAGGGKAGAGHIASSADSAHLVPAIQLLSDLGLVEVESGQVTLHGLTRDLVREFREGPDFEHLETLVAEILTAISPARDAGTEAWPQWSIVTVHLLAQNLTGTPHEQLRRTACAAAYHLYLRGDLEVCRSLAAELYTAWRARPDVGPAAEEVIDIANCLGIALFDAGDIDEARALNSTTLDIARDRWGRSHRLTLWTADNLAADLHGLGLFREAAVLQEQVLAERTSTLGPEHPSTINSLHNLAWSMRAVGDFSAAYALDSTADRLYRRVLGDAHPLTINGMIAVGQDLAALGRIDEAVDVHLRTLEDCQAHLGEDHPHASAARDAIADDLRLLGRHAEAVVYRDKAVRDRVRTLGETHPLTRASRVALEQDIRRSVGHLSETSEDGETERAVHVDEETS